VIHAPPLCYIAGPFSAPTREGVDLNIRKAVALALDVAEAGGFPVCPHANTAHPEFERVQPYEFWIAGTMALLRMCDVCVMVPGWEASSGATGERAEMLALGGPVFETVGEFREWMKARGGK
jgi:hypothetical protein